MTEVVVCLGQDSACIQCGADIRSNGSRGPARVFCDDCKAERNLELSRLHHARRRLASGVVKRSQGMADHHVILLNAIKTFVIYPRRVCAECGVEMRRTVPFGDRCAECSGARNARILRSARLARKAKIQDGVFDPYEVFTACGWRCHYCGVPTPREYRGTFKPTAPEIDHKVPLSRGGSHARDNVVGSCRRCNSDKRAKTPDEFLEWKRARLTNGQS